MSTGLVRLYPEYLHVEYGSLDSDNVFVNLWGQPVGRPLSYQTVDGLIGRLRARTGIFFRAHMLRHSRATEPKIGVIATDATFAASVIAAA